MQFDITLRVTSTSKNANISLALDYQPTIMSEAHAASLLSSFSKVLYTILKEPTNQLRNVSILSDIDMARIDSKQLPTAAEWSSSSFTHHLINKQVEERPDAEAIVSWDGNLTYAQLGHLTTALASELRRRGVKANDFVPVVFPKSAWAIVAMVAIQKAGAAFVPLDPQGPPERLQRILADTKARIALSHLSCRSLIQRLCPGLEAIIVVDDNSVRHLTRSAGDSSLLEDSPATSPHDASFVVFTSGSTGKPKGIVMQHGAVWSTAAAYGSALGIGPDSRVFQFAAYTFDMGLLDILVTLMRGGCLCVPSDDARVNNLEAAINDTEANLISLTPTVGDLLSPEDVPRIKTVCFAGEVASKATIDRWKDKVQLHGIYGPTETSTCAWNPALGQDTKARAKPNNIGRPLLSTFRVVHPSGPFKPLPVGCVGELLVAGPMLARGYLNQDDAGTLDNWAEVDTAGCSSTGGSARIYRTGDLVRENIDGTFDFMGRKDTQIKVRGQRVELAEIESQLGQLLPRDMSVMVDMLKTGLGEKEEALTALLWRHQKGADHRHVPGTPPMQLVDHVPEELQHTLSGLDSSLRVFLPSYMIPSRFCMFSGTPEKTTSGKLNRRAFIAIANRALSERQQLQQSLTSPLSMATGSEAPATKMEATLQQLWSSVLSIPQTSIGRASNFIHLGGDSLTSMKLAAAASKRGLVLNTVAILKHPRLKDMAAEARMANGGSSAEEAQKQQSGLSPAEMYWKTQLQGVTRTPLPMATVNSGRQDNANSTSLSTARNLAEDEEEQGISTMTISKYASITTACLVRAAWALVLATYNGGVDDVCFGATVSSDDRPIDLGIEELARPEIGTVPVRVRLDRQQTVSQFLHTVQGQMADVAAHEQFGLQTIAKLSPDAEMACEFSSLLDVQLGNIEPSIGEVSVRNYLSQNDSKCALVVQVAVTDESLDISFLYDSQLITLAELHRLFRHLRHTIQQLSSVDENTVIGSLPLTSNWDLQKAHQWSGNDVSVVQACIHTLISQRASRDASRQAVFSWDGSLTYGELERLSDRLAHHLYAIGVRPETLLLVCLEKSLWAIVAILGILKAGGAFVPLSPLDPVGRRQQLAQDIKAHFMVASPTVAASNRAIVPNLVELSASLLSSSDLELHDELVSPHPNHAAYVIFTSGSTGLSKSMVIEHAALCTSLKAQSKAFGLDETVRCLQFASHAFDASVAEIFLPLVLGGTVCIPSDTQRLQDISSFIREAGVNAALLTPSFALTVRPEHVPGLETLVLIGEAPSRDLINRWRGHVRLFNGYGPSETVIICAWHAYRPSSSPTTIGRPLHGRCWIVDPGNHNRLVPIGCVGELVVQGPVLARGYINNEAKTMSSFLDSMDWWRTTSAFAGCNRFYKTGDLVRYNLNGTMEYLGRLDTQMKLRGQRIEAGETERSIKMARPDIEHAAVDIAHRQAGSVLVVFLSFKKESDTKAENNKHVQHEVAGVADPKLTGRLQKEHILPMNSDMVMSFAALAKDLAAVLSSYMVPTHYVPLRTMPFVTSMKLDRSRLRALLVELTQKELARFSLEPNSQDGGDDGDDDLSTLIENHVTDVSSLDKPVEPFSLLDEAMLDTVRGDRPHGEILYWNRRPILDAYPCTALQEGLMALTTRQPESYMGKFLFRLQSHVNLDRFHATWDRLVRVFENLRTRIILVNGVSIQIVLDDDDEDSWPLGREVQDMELNTYLRAMKSSFHVTHGSPLCRNALVRGQDGEIWFVWIMHHSIFDGWTMNLLLKAFHRIYDAGEGEQVRREPYNRFIKYVTDLDRVTISEYWRAQLQGARRAQYPRISSSSTRQPGDTKDTSRRFTHRLTNLRLKSNLAVTMAGVLRAAWAIVLARYCDTDDVTFGVAVGGRQASVPGIADMAGATVATVPVRIQLNHREEFISSFLERVHSQAVEMVPFEQFGLQHISALGKDMREACDFSSLLIVQPGSLSKPSSAILVQDDLGNSQAASEIWQGYFNYPLVVQATIDEDAAAVELVLIHDSRVFVETELESIAHHLTSVVQQLLAHPGKNVPLASVSLTSDWDVQNAIQWSGQPAEMVDVCVHDLVSQQVARTPSHEAVFAWDGNITFSELDRLSSLLADALSDAMDVCAETIVPICMEKSKWAVVAILGILKAGGAFVFINPSDPFNRRQHLLESTKARVIIVSSFTATLYSSSSNNSDNEVPRIIRLSASFDSDCAIIEPGQHIRKKRVPARSADLACVVFTSGSTGTPKGILINHTALCSSLTAQCKTLNLGSKPRVLQISNYVFDLCIMEMLLPLMLGGTVCIPSDAQRTQDIAGFMREARVDMASMTPSFASTLCPQDVPGLKTLLLAGEVPLREQVEMWFGHLGLVNAYGPAETIIMCTFHWYTSLDDLPATIGRPSNGRCWIVEPNDYRRLAPTGCVGELIVQGPVLSRGYLNNGKMTGQAFIEGVDWSRHGASTRMYRTGDLVRYNPDGTMWYVGRRDTQVKLRGQRIETGEVEYSIKEALHGIVEHVSVDMVHHESGDMLVCFLQFVVKGETTESTVSPSDNEGLLLPMNETIRGHLIRLADTLRSSLPSYMVPVLFLPLQSMPFSTSMKLDKKRMRSIVEELPRERFAAYSLQQQREEGEKADPVTPMERMMRELWADVLGISPDLIGRNDQFLHIGGDSITAIRLRAAAQKQGIALDVASIFEDSRLHVLATKAREETDNLTDLDLTIEPFALLDESTSESFHQGHALLRDLVLEDAYPCTPFQEGLMALAVKQPGSYTAKLVYRLQSHVDIQRFQNAWEQTVHLCATLRTRIVVIDGVHVQVVVSHDDSGWTPSRQVQETSLSSHMENERSQLLEMTYGSPLARYSLIRDSRDGDGNDVYFVWKMHHAVFDGWTTGLILTTLQSLYDGQEPAQLVPYNGFIRHVRDMDHDAAVAFWAAEMQGASKASFPRRRQQSSPKLAMSASKTFQRNIRLSQDKTGPSGVTIATVLRTAWALVLGRYTDTDDVTFGTTISGRQAPVSGITDMAGAVVATIPIRIRLDQTQSLSKFLLGVQSHASAMVAYEQFGLQNIQKLGPDAKEACNFSSLLVIQPDRLYGSAAAAVGETLTLVDSEGGIEEEGIQNYFTYPLVMRIVTRADAIELVVVYDLDALSELQVIALTNQFEHVVQQLLVQEEGDNGASVGSLSLSSTWDVQRALEINTTEAEPDLIDACLHQLIESQARQHPDSMAIRAWDAELTYSQLDGMANRLSHHLVSEYAVSVDDLIHVCFEKSAWYFVSILAINKAGAAWVPMDPSHPLQHHQQVASQTKARLALASPSNVQLCSHLFRDVVEVTASLDHTLSKAVNGFDYDGQGPVTNVSPANAAYVLFTSGSTGTPKGLVMEHRSVCTSQTALGKRLGFTRDVRMLQFAAFVFDSSIGEIVASLIHGACLYVPSEEIRMNTLASFVADMDINWAILTPSFIRTLKPSDVPSLELVILGGEPAGQDIFNTWFGKVRLINGWGPAEACVISCLHEWTSRTESAATIGRSVGGFCWIVDPDDLQRLAPIGTLGEVVIQSPTLLREYLSDPTRTEAALVRSLPQWAPHRLDPRWSRFYRTGDLCYYNPDGTMEFVTRRDTQVKIRGLRVELGEIEHHIRTSLQGRFCHVAVDVFRRDAGLHLVSYLCFQRDTILTTGTASGTKNDLFLPLTSDLRDQITAMVGQLSVVLPHSMVPTLYVPCRYMPFITSTKLDKKRLQSSLADLTQEQLAMYSLLDGERQKRAPETLMETRLQRLWAVVLHIPADTIGRDDSFLKMGGDSVVAIQLISIAREAGIDMTVRDIFDDPRLSAVASKAVEMSSQDDDEEGQTEMVPFGLIQSPLLQELVLSDNTRTLFHLEQDETVEDAYPCTPLQEGLMALAVKQPGSYTADFVYQLPKHVDIARFKQAWDHVFALCSNLRTRIVSLDGTAIQAVIGCQAKWESVAAGRNLRSYMKEARELEMAYGSPLSRFALVHDHGTDYFVWTIHHAIYDGWTMGLMLRAIESAYLGVEMTPLQPYAGFIRYVQDIPQNAANDFWKAQLQGARRATFPPAPSRTSAAAKSKTAIKLLKRTLDMPTSTSSPTITKASLLRAAWAVVLARYCETDDVTFGSSVSGRNAPVPGLSGTPGLTVATIPVRVHLDSCQSVSQFLHNVQTQALDMVPYEQFGTQNISKLSPEIKDACDFTSLLVLQTNQSTLPSTGGDAANSILVAVEPDKYAAEEFMQGYFSYPLVVQCFMLEDRVDLLMVYDSSVISEYQATALQHQYNHVVQQLLAPMDSNARLDSMTVASPWDLEQAVASNADVVPETIQTCVHTVIEEQARIRPNAMAICAWDAQLTYRDLDHAANRLAHHIVSNFTILADDMIPVCFEKSAWFFVAILAVNKTGAAWVPLDPSSPAQLHEQIIKQTNAKLALTSPTNFELCKRLVENVIEVSKTSDENLVQEVESSLKAPETDVSPRNAVFVLFTSDSRIGTPRGVVMDHESICTSQHDISKRLKLTPSVRMLQFASYGFDLPLSIGEILAPLLSGACLCVPSEEDIQRGSIADFIRAMEVNWAFLTPDFARTLRPADVPSLELLLLFDGESATGRDVRDIWFGKVPRLLHAWGPPEACVFSALHEWQSLDEPPSTMGRPVGGFCWILDPEDSSRLAPTGTVGEVVVQGPTIMREYLGDLARTEASIVKVLPEWASHGGSTPWGWSRFYKSGDLAVYNADQTIRLVARKDRQVEVQGLRVDLSEAEYQIRSSLKAVRQVTIDLFESKGESLLVAYLCFSEAKVTAAAGFDDKILLPITGELQREMTAMLDYLNLQLPSHMIPTLFIPCRHMPFATSAKVDKDQLKTVAASLSREELAIYALLNGPVQVPETPLEIEMQALWAKTLNIPVESIRKNDNFLRLGGDSIAAMRLISLARENGVSISITDIFDDARLSTIASKAIRVDYESHSNQDQIAPFSLLDEATREEVLSKTIGSESALGNGQELEDAYPCTKLQEGLMALSAKQPGSYIARQVYQLPSHINVDRFKMAWAKTVDLCGNLRTRISLIGHVPVQMVVKEELQWEPTLGSDVSDFVARARQLEMSYGSRLCRQALIKDKSKDSKYHFILVVHHAVFDGWSMQLMLDTLSYAYRDIATSVRSYAGFIQYTMDLDMEAAARYWRSQLHEASRATFPLASPPSASSKSEDATRIMKKAIAFTGNMDSTITKATILRAAWAVVLARYCDTEDVCFATTVSGRNAPVSGLFKMPGPVLATVPVRVRLDRSQPVSNFLSGIQQQAAEMVAHEQFGLQSIIKAVPDAKEACDFTSLLVVQPTQQLDSTDTSADSVLVAADSESFLMKESMEGYFNYPLIVQGILHDEHVELVLIYDSAILPEARVKALSEHYNHTVQQLLAQDEMLLGSINLSGDWDIQQALQWNPETPQVIDSCVHSMIEEQARLHPTAPAIQAWDAGELTYRQLDQYSNALAHFLSRSQPISPGDIIHVCFYKSAWFIVAILAINKAGAAWAPLDPSHPLPRQRQIVSQTKAKLALSCPANVDLCEDLVDHVLKVTPDLIKNLVNTIPDSVLQQPPSSGVSSSDIAYILFTSGTTGVPKGFIMEHASVCTSETAIGKRLGFSRHTRMLNFSAHTFDSTIFEVFCTLLHGGCVCTPLEETRLDARGLKDFIARSDINTALFTPTFARTLKAEELPSLEKLVLAGEATPPDVFEAWFGKVRLFNGWGPSETCVMSSIHEWSSIDESTQIIGRPVGGFCWLVDPDDPHELAPIGAVGEVVIQGPTLLRDYLVDPANPRKSPSIVTSLPSWAPRRTEAKWNRFYKTGDLASYTSHGAIQYSGRKDTQIKIRGLRVELGDIEHHMRAFLKEAKQVAADVFRDSAGLHLVAYICLNDDTRTDTTTIKHDKIFMPVDSTLKLQLAKMIGDLSITLPQYMIPSFFIPCRFMPLVSSTKLDRNILRNLTVGLGREALAQFALSDEAKRPPETQMEERMQQLWSEVLGVPADAIGRDDSFLRIGGDSITAIQVVSSASKVGMYFTVRDLFADPRLWSIASKASNTDDEAETEADTVAPFDLVSDEQVHAITTAMSQNYSLADASYRIQDAYPCTPLQEGFMALSVKQPGSYTAKHLYRLGPRVDIQRFQRAWNQTVQLCDNLRTRIIILGGTSLQVVLREDEVTWGHSTRDMQDIPSLSAYMNNADNFVMTYGSALSRYSLLRDGDDDDVYFLWTLHHAIYDGWAMGLILDTFYKLYDGSQDPTVSPFGSYSRFIRHVTDIDHDAAADFWASELQGAHKALFPRIPISRPTLPSSRVFSKRINIATTVGLNVTLATVLRAAWAIVLARYTDTSDVTFGTSISGRQAPVRGITSMVGALVATVPVRVRRIDPDLPVESFLQSMQDQSQRSIPFEQFGLQNIAQINTETRDACDFSSLLVIQPPQIINPLLGGGGAQLLSTTVPESVSEEESLNGYFTYPLVLQVIMNNGTAADLNITYDTGVISEHKVENLANHYSQVVEQLVEGNLTLLGDISVAGLRDLEQAFDANFDEEVEVVHDCVHRLIQAQAQRQPEAMAIRAWDADFTYSDLDATASRIAHHLSTRYGVQAGDLVLTCFEKSAWFFVALLAINKVGAAWVPLDPAHPLERQREITRQTGSTLALASPLQASKCGKLVKDVVEVTAKLDKGLKAELGSRPAILKSIAKPEHAAYVLFTSGSTGTPKGLVMQHKAVCTSQIAIAKRLRLDSSVRILQFASFVFDFCVGEAIGPLIAGATICIPSEETRLHRLEEFMCAMEVNWALLTPSVARTLRPEDTPTLELLLLTGEAVGRDLLETWFGRVRLVTGWGPAETCVFSSVHEWQSANDSPQTIGRPVGGFCWVVDPTDPYKLAPTGCVGEVVIQGPTLLREYLADKAKTEASTVTNLPLWAPRREDVSWNRFFKSGDLCYYNDDGTLEFVSRKDTQVKIRGLRVELGEVEHHILRQLPKAQHIAVDALRNAAGTTTNLVCFFSFTNQDEEAVKKSKTRPLQPMTKRLQTMLLSVTHKLRQAMPDYMIPTIWMPLEWMPTSGSSKLDRRALLTIVKELSEQELVTYFLLDAEKQDPRTQLEANIRSLWAQVLGKPEDLIGINDNFHRLGGDSIRVITLSKQIEKHHGVNLIQSLIRTEHTTIVEMARHIENVRQGLVGTTDGTTESSLNLAEEIDTAMLPFTSDLMEQFSKDTNSNLACNATVFLTGASGYLGGEMMRQLLQSDRFQTVVAHVRAHSRQEGLERLVRTGQVGGWWKDAYMAKLEVWIGDLGKPRIGLDDSQWQRLAGTSTTAPNVDAIVHNGAVVNWSADYTALHAANVASVSDLLQLTMTSPVKPKFIFISGGVKMDTQTDVQESARLLAHGNGYIQTKFVAETMINKVARRLPPDQNRISIIKPGRIIGTPKEGLANVDDYTWRVVGTAVALGYYPVGKEDVWLHLQTTDWISSLAIKTLALPVNSGGLVAFNDLKMGMPTNQFWDIIQAELPSNHSCLKPLPWDEWSSMAVALANEVGERHPLYPIQSFLGAMGWPESPSLEEQTRDNLPLPALETAIAASIKYLAGTGYFSLCGGDDVELQGIIHRSTAVKM